MSWVFVIVHQQLLPVSHLSSLSLRTLTAFPETPGSVNKIALVQHSKVLDLIFTIAKLINLIT